MDRWWHSIELAHGIVTPEAERHGAAPEFAVDKPKERVPRQRELQHRLRGNRCGRRARWSRTA